MQRANRIEEMREDARIEFEQIRNVLHNLEAPRLYEEAVRGGEGRVAESGALSVETGAHTGRSAQDKFIVRDSITDASVWWPNNLELSPQHFDALAADMLSYAKGRRLFAQDLYGCADPSRRLSIRVYTENAWRALFIRNLLIRPSNAAVSRFAPAFTVLDLPSFKAKPERHGCRSETIIALDFSRRLALIGGTSYAGEIKKAVFSFLSFHLPFEAALPMHCAASSDDNGVALFFGLSGTGKTTLSADASRLLIGDDEHGWDMHGVFNFEGGCYAKAIRLSREAEPQIFAASHRFGAIWENVTIDPVSRAPRFEDDSLTENTRVAYPLDFIANASSSGRAGHPKDIVMLTCDAFGVLPPIAKLNPAQAIYHFLSGYTAKLAGTEKGAQEPQAAFSTCFGAPFMPRRPWEYGAMLRDRIIRHKVNCWLLNTGWSGGRFGVGQRMPLQLTRKLLRAALDGSLAREGFRVDPYFGLSVPNSAPGVDNEFLDPAKTWSDKQEFVETTRKLMGMFEKNFEPFAPFVERDVIDARPRRVSA